MTETVPVLPETCSKCGGKAVALVVLYSEINTTDALAHFTPLCEDHADVIVGYVIDYDRMQTLRQAFNWTLHLSEKTWYQHTDWTAWMYEIFRLGGLL